MTAAAVAEPQRPRTLTWFAAAALVVFAVIAVDYWRDNIAVEASLDPAELQPGFGPRTYAEALANAERGIEGARERVANHPGEWLHMEGLARALMARYRLTASPQELAEADRLLDEALAAAPYPAGPNLTRALVALTAHDFPAAEAALERMEASAAGLGELEQLEARSIRCEMAFERGRMAEAERLCGGSEDLGLRLRLANMAAKRGDTAEAARGVEALMRTPGLAPSSLAQLALQRASIALAEGDWEASGRWARAADRIFPGYWLSEAFIAQQDALEGQSGEARRKFAALAEQTGNPDVMDALAALAEADGDEAGAQAWAVRAGAAWDARMDLLPDAYRTHFGEYLLTFGDPGKALEMAHAEYSRRPFSTPAVNYARALLANRQADEALAVLRDTERRGFRTAAMKIEENRALVVLRRMDQARIARQQAFALNSRIEDPRQRFVFFDQD